MSKHVSRSQYDLIASLVISQFKKLPPKAKPLIRSDGIPEWTTLAGVVVETRDSPLHCVTLATGVKSTPDGRLDEAQGKVLHDMHAEVLCLRGFNKFVLSECLKLSEGTSQYLEKVPKSSVQDGPYRYRGVADLKIYLYVSEAPCGDCSLSNVAEMSEKKANQNGSQLEEWDDPLTPITPKGPLRGRDHFFHTGFVRTKPGRRDSPVTMSKSCSDKLALKQFTSILLGATASIVSPEKFYISKLVVPESELSESAFSRAFGPNGRLASLAKPSLEWPLEYCPQFFESVPTQIEFPFSRRSGSDVEPKPSPQALIYIQGEDKNTKGNKPTEGIINGTRMGFKPFSGKGQSAVSRYEIAKAVRALSPLLEDKISYLTFKERNIPRRTTKQRVYEVLKNWVRTKTDDFIF